ncbi:MAG: hypothetical protein ACLP8Y_04770 [Thermoplasmata archaeon]
MSAPSAVLITPRSPELEPVALAVLRGVSEGGGVAPRTLIVTSPSGVLDVSSDAPIAFVGWYGNGERSRRLASEILAALARQPPSPRPVALFETRVLGPADTLVSGIPPSPRDCPGLHFLGTPERFVLREGAYDSDADSAELDRARRWAAQVYRRWNSAPSDLGTAASSPELSRSPAKWMSWCGAFE